MKEKPSLINIIWLLLILTAIIAAAFTGKMEALTQASFESAKAAVNLAINLIGAMALWLGIMKVAEDGGLLKKIARLIRPVMTKLFPDVPGDHPAMSAMIMNIAANMLGLGNAATPLGIKAMEELNTINPEKETATNAMCLFLALNTSSVALLPLGVIAVRSAAGASNPTSIFFPTIFATVLSTLTAIVSAKLIMRLPSFRANDPMKNYSLKNKEMASSKNHTTNENSKGNEATDNEIDSDKNKKTLKRFSVQYLLTASFFILFFTAFVIQIAHGIISGNLANIAKDLLSFWVIPLLMASLILYGYVNNVKVYESLTNGAKEGFNVALRIIPFLVAILVAVGMFRASGALDLLVMAISPITELIGMPADVLPMALIRPLSGSGAFGVMSEIVNNAPDSLSSFMVSTMQGSTETTFYVLAIYFGAISIRKTRFALHSALLADLVGILASVFICNLMF